MEPFRQSMRRRSGLASAFGRGSQATASQDLRDSDINRRGQAALDLVRQIADTVSATENRMETLLVRALEQIKIAEDRNGALEKRVREAETLALEAEKWLRRLHSVMEDKFTSWNGEHVLGSATA